MNDSPKNARRPSQWILIGLFLVLAFNFAIRWHLRAMALERDEGEYAYAGQLILQGILPYKLAFNMKFPGTYFMYALLMAIFGQSAPGIHAGIILVTSLTALLIFFIGRELLSDSGGLIATAIYVCLAALPKAAGLAGHATHFVSLFACAAVSAVLMARKRNSRPWWFISGTAFGLAILMKQHAVFFPLFILIWFLWNERRNETPQKLVFISLLFCAGCILPFLAAAILFACAGVWHAFIFWTFEYARQYVSMLPLGAAPGQFVAGFDPVFESGIWVWIFGIAGLICLWRKPKRPGTADTNANDEPRPTAVPSPLPSDGRGEGQGEVRVRALPALMFLAGLAATIPGFYFRNHYFLMAMPGLALLNAAFIFAATQFLRDRFTAQR
ncbi:MAG TPA: glycosyltransferase family 39 protein, partial [Alphaproteobacteria bacterium]|nr:glycosyltransferase family 39 protein [Alphaproteobacteria bacterium]